MANLLTLTCPHCDTPNPAFGAQRCTSCSLVMRSDREQAQLQEELQPLVAKLEEMVGKWEADATQVPNEAHLRVWMEQLVVSVSAYPFLETYLADLRQRLRPWYLEMRRQQLLRINWAILLLLAVAPMLAVWWTEGWILPLLLSLPVLGWAYIGIYPLIRSAT